MSHWVYFTLGVVAGVGLMVASLALAVARDQRYKERVRAANRRMDRVHGDHNVCSECGATGSHTGYCSKSMMYRGSAR